uniref:Uncharacterized protein n=1 Tax=Megaselia scalaris TaxID=36166 RepID=T1GDK9_MEGSC
MELDGSSFLSISVEIPYGPIALEALSRHPWGLRGFYYTPKTSEILQLVLAVEINNDQMTGMNILGLVMCLGGICCHLIHKYSLILKLDVQTEEDESPGTA